jgi:anti-anti-sigma regulatory factor
MLHKKVQGYKGELRLCALEPEVQELISVTQLHKLFVIEQGEPTAQENFW